MTPICVMWFRRDLRLHDNAALYYALTSPYPVLPIFIFDADILSQLPSYDRRVHFIHNALVDLQAQLTPLNSSLHVYQGKPLDAWLNVLEDFNVKAVYTNHDYEPYARLRDSTLESFFKDNGIIFNTYKDQVIFEKDDILKDDQTPYTVYTPYSKKWKAKLSSIDINSYPAQLHYNNFHKTAPVLVPSLKEIGFEITNTLFPEKETPSDIIKQYHLTRDIPGIQGTSRLSVHLRFGTISIRELVQAALTLNEKYLNELIWREFYFMILWHFPNTDKAFKTEYDSIEWLNSEADFEAWKNGLTGYPIVDAGMRELNITGYLHNRVRMIVASFLTKHLLIDWRWGEAYFAEKLLDYELASNNGGWQWASSSGCDAAPYFRIFNPYIQTEKFDPEHHYIKKWVPELDSDGYPKPIVDHTLARKRALNTYSKALGKEIDLFNHL